MSKLYNLNGVEYNKEEIEQNKDLKLELLRALRKEHLKIVNRASVKKYRETHRDKIREYNREYQRKKYNENEEYKIARLTYQRKYNGKNYDEAYLPQLVGRPSNYKLDDELNLISV